MPSQEASPRAPRRTKADLVATALRILDSEGLPGLSMRRIADALGVQPSALYWHFPNKQELLAAVSRAILEPEPTEAGDWPQVLAMEAMTFRRRLLAHRDGAELVSSSYALDLVRPGMLDRVIAAGRDAGLSDRAARVTANTLAQFTLGFTFFQQQRAAAAALGLHDVVQPGSDDDAERAFADGLELIVAGVAA